MNQFNFGKTEEEYDHDVAKYFSTGITVGVCIGLLAGIAVSILAIKFVI